MPLTAINPAGGETLASFDETTPAEVQEALARSQGAFADWRARPLAERASLIGALESPAVAAASEAKGEPIAKE
jgi:succinate-semialdehyde dehydrogenase/glutarate-semialdehyde dehydrogenase